MSVDVRIIVDTAVRYRLWYGLAFALAAIGWMPGSFGGVPAGLTLLPLGFVVGPMRTFGSLWAREMRVLPVERRTLWRTTWGASVLVPPLVTGLGRLFTLAIQAAGGWRPLPATSVLLVGLYEFAYLGVTLVVMAFSSVGPRHLRGRVAQAVHVLTFAAMLAWLVAPLWSMRGLPVTFVDLPLAGLAALLVAVLLSMLPLVWMPASASGPALFERAKQSPKSARAPHVLDRMTGFPRLALSHVASAFGMSGAVILLIVSVELVLPTFPGTGPDAAFAGMFLMLFTESGDSEFPILFAMLFSYQGHWIDHIRLLKVLPVRTTQLTFLLLSTPLLLGVAVWTTLTAIHFVVTGTAPATFRLDLFAFWVGLGALMGAVGLRFRSKPWGFFVSILPAIAASVLLTASRFQGRAAFVVVGIAAFVVAALLHHRTLTRATGSSPAYQRLQAPFTPGQVSR